VKIQLKKNKGFTLVEILIVITIIAVLAGGAWMMLNPEGIIGGVKNDRVQTDIDAIELQFGVYQSRNLRVPTEEQGIEALVKKPTSEPIPQNWSQLMKKIPMDPWGSKYFYKVPGEHGGSYDLYSAGPDGEPGTEDDIGNWEPLAEE
jgi:general secretion pathway protein G